MRLWQFGVGRDTEDAAWGRRPRDVPGWASAIGRGGGEETTAAGVGSRARPGYADPPSG